MPSFDPGEYTHDEAFGGAHAHCLDQCCHDPSCTGLALESSELYQCYKYSKLPVGLDSNTGRSLGDGRWMQQKSQKWSIVVKASKPKALAVRSPQPLRHPHSSNTTQSLASAATVHKPSGPAPIPISVAGSIGGLRVDFWTVLQWIPMVATLTVAFVVFASERVRIFSKRAMPFELWLGTARFAASYTDKLTCSEFVPIVAGGAVGGVSVPSGANSKLCALSTFSD